MIGEYAGPEDTEGRVVWTEEDDWFDLKRISFESILTNTARAARSNDAKGFKIVSITPAEIARLNSTREQPRAIRTVLANRGEWIEELRLFGATHTLDSQQFWGAFEYEALLDSPSSRLSSCARQALFAPEHADGTTALLVSHFNHCPKLQGLIFHVDISIHGNGQRLYGQFPFLGLSQASRSRSVISRSTDMLLMHHQKRDGSCAVS